MRAIAEASGLTCPTLYYHFGSKEGLAQALLLRPVDRLAETLRGLIDQPLDPVERLVRTTEAFFAFSLEDPDRTRFFYAVMFGPLGKGLAAEVDGIIHRLNALMLEAAGRLAEAGIVPEDLVPDLTLALRGQIVIRTMDFLYRDGPLGPDLARRVVARVLIGHSDPRARSRIETSCGLAGGSGH